MTVTIRHPDGNIFLYTKGADSSILPRVSDKTDATVIALSQKILLEQCNVGLRTLCIANRKLSVEVYENWRARYAAASKEIGDRKAKMEVFCLLNLILL